jgi:hypothetical protein
MRSPSDLQSDAEDDPSQSQDPDEFTKPFPFQMTRK